MSKWSMIVVAMAVGLGVSQAVQPPAGAGPAPEPSGPATTEPVTTQPAATRPTEGDVLGAVKIRGASTTIKPTEEPVAAYLAYTELARKGDAVGMLKFYHFETPAERRVADALVKGDLALAKLSLATFEKFGRAAMVRQQEAIGDARPEAMTGRTVSLPGIEAANLIDDRGNPVVSLIAVDGKWKVFVKTALQFWESEEKLLKAVSDQTTRADLLREALVAGKFKSIDELLAVIAGR